MEKERQKAIDQREGVIGTKDEEESDNGSQTLWLPQ